MLITNDAMTCDAHGATSEAKKMTVMALIDFGMSITISHIIRFHEGHNRMSSRSALRLVARVRKLWRKSLALESSCVDVALSLRDDL